ncbi:precorrin-6A reductase [Parasporobacterium paucivorans]|uniref:Precorrin-6Y C5,15-methyltransferase (Decarboxylating) n=1 Tax=Parasporobacterium paucivorans DSM 15970 TaxID=1122934 RepID=A0A1M6DTR3_9FIRM|nr:bifunctional cobalt-precorrin-7 (C(5))-methyltransferase/cobalt-precorrin-6B (C(15))-methyltransferase [Parasporobacterium paucivorans]SHI76591.1 precorrin-6Y C5,15-methyltransferase (decarboxylating) [Parasporobacterium paucivorans DSM 15970]
MSDVLLFGGTAEGRKIAEYLSENKVKVHTCVATDYAGTLLPASENVSVSIGRLDVAQMKELICELERPLVIDATHPHAAIVTENIKNACILAGAEYIRLVRNSSENPDASYLSFSDIDGAVEYLKKTEGNILVATGSKELSKYTAIDNYRDRVFARVLSTGDVAQECSRLGFEGRNLICMQGPFSLELNYSMLRHVDAKYLVTKESGGSGGFAEKLEAAHKAGASVLVIGRPAVESGMSLSDCILLLRTRFFPETVASRKIILSGIGMGSRGNMTVETCQALDSADLIIGAKRLTDAAGFAGKAVYNSYKDSEIKKYIEEHPEYRNIVVALSGDAGFYSGAKRLLNVLDEYKPEILCGIPTVSYLCSKLGESWEDAYLASIHGREENILDRITKYRKVFALLGGNKTVDGLCRELIYFNLKDVTIHVGESLSYPDEKITSGKPEEILGKNFASLSAVLIVNENVLHNIVTHGIPDEEFLRARVPMTKEEVRSVSLSKLRLKKNSIIYDIGAGTGSVSIEMSLQSPDGMVYAIEKNEEAVQLIELNRIKFRTGNLRIIQALAPDGLADLPAPTHAFIGGSSGNMKEILKNLLEKNPQIRIVINASTLETMGEIVGIIGEIPLKDLNIVQVNVSRAKKIGNYHMMEGVNPVSIISFTGAGQGGTSCGFQE